MKKIFLIACICMMTIFFVGCEDNNDDMDNEKIVGVEVEEVSLEEKPINIKYVGNITASEMVNYSFKSGGKISKILVEKGDFVKSGDPLAEIDTSDLLIQLDVSKASMNSALSSLETAKESRDYTKNLLKNMEDLYKSGAASKDQYDQVKLQADSSENSYTQAKLQYDTAVVDYEYKSDLLNESKIYSGNDGTVISIPYEENERVTANTPIVIVRSENQVVHIGIAQQDLKKIEIGRSAFVDVDGEVASGVINYIADAPDSSTRTYDVEIKIDGKEFPMGAIAKVSIDAGTEKGFWVPMNSIFSNGEDYVYIVREGRAFKQLVELKDVSDDKIRVDGLNEGDFLAVSGMKNLSDGGKVNVLEEVDDEQANSTTN